MPTITCKQIRDAVNSYNNRQSLGDDLALRAGLVGVQTLPHSFARLMEVCLIADWGTIVNFSFRDRLVMAQEIEICWPVLQWVQTLSDSGEVVMKAGLVDVLSLYTCLLPTRGSKKGQLSFLSKYLHWCINNAFPIWDSNARKVLGGSDDRTWSTYKDWLDRVRQELDNHKGCCLPRVQLPGESLVRTLDKALYTIGSELS